MRFIIFLLAVSSLIYGLSACSPKQETNAALCDTAACFKDTLKFVDENHKLKPYLYISAKDCKADTVTWSHGGQEENRKMSLNDLLGVPVNVNRDFISGFIKDTSYVWLAFNDCVTGRGYSLKIPFAASRNIQRKGSAINDFDPKFSIEKGIAAYTDRGNIFIEEMPTDKKAMMTFGEMVDIDYDAIHESIDSVNVTSKHVWVKIKIGGNWVIKEKNITLQ